MRRLLLALVFCVVCAPGFAKPTVSAETPVRTSVALTTNHVDDGESDLGDLTADALRLSNHTDGAFIAAASFVRSSRVLGPGTIDVDDIYEAFQFPSEAVAIVKLSGKQIVSGLKMSFTLYPVGYSGFLQISGITASVAMNHGSAVISNVKIDNKLVQPNQFYKIAMPLTLANGAQGYFRVWDKDDIVSSGPRTLKQSIEQYFKQHPDIAKGDRRLVVLQQ